MTVKSGFKRDIAEEKTFAEDYYSRKENNVRNFSKESKMSWNRLAVQLMSNRMLRRERQRFIAVEQKRLNA